MKNKGFTLIELLVVIAIIGILSSVVLASLTTARSRGTAAAIQSEMSNARAQAELYYSTNGNSYGVATDCSTNLFGTANNGLGTIIGGLNTKTTMSCHSSATAWAMKSADVGGVYYCVDSTGTSTTRTSNPDITDENC